jgi:hypothetical protein
MVKASCCGYFSNVESFFKPKRALKQGIEPEPDPSPKKSGLTDLYCAGDCLAHWTSIRPNEQMAWVRRRGKCTLAMLSTKFLYKV